MGWIGLRPGWEGVKGETHTHTLEGMTRNPERDGGIEEETVWVRVLQPNRGDHARTVGSEFQPRITSPGSRILLSTIQPPLLKIILRDRESNHRTTWA